MSGCHETINVEGNFRGGNIALVGQPNVGKSVLFQRLTGRYVTVSNYPGTTIEITRGAAQFWPDTAIIDTPGVITFPPRSEDERAAARVLLEEKIRTIVQVGDAKNLRRTLLLAVQLIEMGLPMVLALNMSDEADARGVMVNYELLSQHLDLRVIPTVATRGVGVDELTFAITAASEAQFRLSYPLELETTLAEICALIPETPISARSLALLWLSEDEMAANWLESRLDAESLKQLKQRRDMLQHSFTDPLPVIIQRARQAYVEQIASQVVRQKEGGWKSFSSWLGSLSVHPLWGLPLLAFVLYGIYWFVGIFGAGTLVGLLEENLFAQIINPWVTGWIQRLVPIPLLSDFLVGEYGLWTMGMTYALALILPIVSTFFLSFSILEDSGYLPRLAVLTNRVFDKMGLNGKAVLPMVLGLGCVTMATMTTRILDNKRDRLLVILLLALAVPCSAQLGVVMGMLAGISFTATSIWVGVVAAVFLVVGWLAARLIPGERSILMIELPPMRLPVLSNVLVKTYTRVEWYLKEVVPLFLLGTAIMYTMQITGILPWLVQAGQPLIEGWLGLPAEASSAFLLGFLRRDFGATGLFVMESQGLLSPLQVVVAMVTITLFIPCIASIMMIVKERGTKTAVAISALIFPLAFLIGGILNRVLLLTGF